MKKIFIAGAAMLALTACQIGPAATPSDYTSLYNANVKAEIQKSADFFKSLIGKNQEMTGNFSTKMNLASSEMKMAIEGSSDLVVLGESSGQKSEFTLAKPKFSYEIESASNAETPFKKLNVNFSADEVALVSSLFGAYAKYNNMQLAANLDVNVGAEDRKSIVDARLSQAFERMTKKLQEFSGKWIYFEMDEYQAKQNAIMLKLLSLTASDFEKYLTKYQILTPVSETPVMNGSKAKFDVQFHSENLVNLIAEFVKDVVEYEMTDSDKKNLLEELQEISLQGTLVFDTKDPLYSEFDGVISRDMGEIHTLEAQSSGVIPTFKLHSLRDGGKLEFTGTALMSTWNLENGKRVIMDGGEEQTRITFTSTETRNNVDFTLKVFGPNLESDNGEKLTEMATLSGKVEDNILKTLDGNLSTGPFMSGKLMFRYGDKLTAEASFFGKQIFALEHTVNGDKHSGTMVLDNKDVAKWALEMKRDELSALSLHVENLAKYSSYADLSLKNSNSPLISLNLEKKDNDDFARGDFVINLGEEKISANVALQVAPKAGKFGMVVDKISLPKILTMYSRDPLPTYFEFFATSKNQETDKTVTLPTETISVDQFAEAMRQLEDEFDQVENLFR